MSEQVMNVEDDIMALIDDADSGARDLDTDLTPPTETETEESTSAPVPEVSEEDAALGLTAEDVAPTKSESSDAATAAPKQDGGAELGKDGEQQIADADYVPRGQIKPDATGNLVDESGKIVAKAGAERRWFEKANGLQRYVSSLQQAYDGTLGKVQELERKLEEAGKAPAEAAQWGLTRSDASRAMQLAASYKQDPINTLKHMLTEAKADGYNLDGIVSSHIDMAAMKRMFEQYMGTQGQPAQAQPQAQQQPTTATQPSQDAVQQANLELDRFLIQYPAAGQNLDVLAEMSAKSPSDSPETLWLKLENFARRNGLDLNQPLSPQISVPRSAQPASQQQQPAPKPMRTGATTARADDVAALDNTLVPGGDMDNDAILLQELRAHGFNV